MNWRESNKHVTDKSLAGWCAIELALIDLLSKEKGISIEQMLNVSPPGNNQKITAVIGDFEIDSFEKNVNKYHQLSFFDFKLKMSGDIKRDQQKIDCIRRIKNTNELTIRADYNNCFKDEYTFLRYYEKLNYAFIAIEEPIVKNSIDKLELIAEETSTPIILDESFVSISDLAKVSNPSLLIPNIRISKLGGIMNAIDTYRKLVNTFSRFILGSHVGETSILTRYFCIALDEMQQNLIGAEGGYSTYILEEDLASPSINTMPPGIIELPLDTRNNSGIGINIDINSKYLKHFQQRLAPHHARAHVLRSRFAGHFA